MGPEAKRVGGKAAGVCGLGWCEAERAAAQHGGHQAVHNQLRLHVQVAIHFIGTPSSNETDAVAVNAGTKESHGAAGTSGTRGDVGGGVGGIGMHEKCHTDATSEIGGKNMGKRSRGVGADGINRGLESGEVAAQAEKTGRDKVDGAQVRVARTTVADRLISGTVLLSGKGEGNKRGGEKSRRWGR